MNHRKSDEDHALNGTTAASGPETILTPSRPRCPKELTKDERAIFRSVCREMEKRRQLTSGDAEIIRLLAVTITRHKTARQHVLDEGEVVQYTRLDKKGEQVQSYSRNLWLAVEQEAEGKILSLLDRLGLTPLNRPRVRQTRDDANKGIKFL